MSASDILSQDEIDALLHGVEEGDIETGGDLPLGNDGAELYDFASQDRIVRGRLPTLEMINERFVRQFRASLFNLLRRSPEVSAGTVQMLKFSEYVHSLFVPANMSLVKIRPLRGTALFVFDPNLVFMLVENFFGGVGRMPDKVEGREFTPAEERVVRLVLNQIFVALKDAWKPVLDVSFEYQGGETNPNFANIASPSEVVVATVFHIELAGGGGDLHVTVPYAMLEPIKDLLDAGLQSDQTEPDSRWGHALRRGIQTAEVGLEATLGKVDISLKELMDLRPGDVIPMDMPELVTASVQGIPVFRGKYGVYDGNAAIKVQETAQQIAQSRAAEEREQQA